MDMHCQGVGNSNNDAHLTTRTYEWETATKTLTWIARAWATATDSLTAAKTSIAFTTVTPTATVIALVISCTRLSVDMSTFEALVYTFSIAGIRDILAGFRMLAFVLVVFCGFIFIIGSVVIGIAGLCESWKGSETSPGGRCYCM